MSFTVKEKHTETETETEIDNHVLDHLFVIQDRLDIKEFNFIHFYVCYFISTSNCMKLHRRKMKKLWNERNCYKFTIQRPFSVHWE